MKKIYFILLMLCVAGYRAGAQDLMDQIANYTCDCVEKQMKDLKTKSQVQMAIGICVLEASEGKEKLLKQKYNIDLDNDPESGTKLGEQIGIRMATKCPGVFKMFIEDELDKAEEPESDDKIGYGELTEVNEAQFMSFVIKDDDQNSVEYFWMEDYDAPEGFQEDPTNFLGKRLILHYITRKAWSPKKSKYVMIRVVTGIEAED